MPAVTKKQKNSEMDPNNLTKHKSSSIISHHKAKSKNTKSPNDHLACELLDTPNRTRKPRTKPPDVQDDPMEWPTRKKKPTNPDFKMNIKKIEHRTKHSRKANYTD